MKALIFDTETNGLPKNWNTPMTDVDNWPRVIQLAWILCEDDIILDRACFLIKPDGWEVPHAPFWIKHGYSTERCREEGVIMELGLFAFFLAYEEADVLVAHNLKFDYNVLGAEMIRNNSKPRKKIPHFCTMENSVDVCKLPNKKWPKLEEVYQHFFKEDFNGAHDAGNDVEACMKVYYKLIEK